MANNRQLISVVVPVYNVQDYLPQTLDCVIAQTYKHWELILVDDGSSDKSIDIARAYCEKDKRIILLQRGIFPKGAPTCRNIGLQNSNGKYVIFLDSDDIIPPYCFQQRIDYIESRKCDFVVFPIVGYYQNYFDAEDQIYGYKVGGDIVYDFLARSLPFVVVSNIYLKDALLKSNITWDTSLKSFQDSDYNLQALRAGLTYEISNLVPDYYYRLSSSNSICKKLQVASNCMSQIGFIKKQINYYGSNTGYRNALLICAAQVFQNILKCKENEEVIRDFVELEIIRNVLFLKQRLFIINSLSRYINSELVVNILQMLLYPSFFLNFKIYFRKKFRRNCVLYKEVANQYFKK